MVFCSYLHSFPCVLLSEPDSCVPLAMCHPEGPVFHEETAEKDGVVKPFPYQLLSLRNLLLNCSPSA